MTAKLLHYVGNSFMQVVPILTFVIFPGSKPWAFRVVATLLRACVLLLLGMLVVKKFGVQCLYECFPPFVRDMAGEAKYPTEKVMKLLDWCLAKVEIYFPSHRSEMHWGISRGGRRGRAVRLILDASFCKNPPSWKVGRVVPAQLPPVSRT